MSNLSDKDIDRLSREAAEHYEPDDSMMSWSKIEQQLFQQIPERPPDMHSPFRVQPLVWGPAVLLLTGITYFIVKNTTYRKHSTLKGQTEKIISQPVEKVAQGQGISEDNTKPSSAQAGNAPKAAVPTGKTGVVAGSSSETASEKATAAVHSKPDGTDAPSVNANSRGAGSKDLSANTTEGRASESINSGNHRKVNKPEIKTGDNNSIAKKTGSRGSADKGSADHAGKNYPATSDENSSRPNGSLTNGSKTKNTIAYGAAGHKAKTPNHNAKDLSGEEIDLSTTGSAIIQQDLSASMVYGSAGQITSGRTAHAYALPSVIISNDQPVVSGNDSSLNRFTSSKESQKPPLPKSLQINRSLVFGMIMGPDYTSAGGMTNDQLSDNLGISIGYYLTGRISVNTGISLTTKYYWAEGKKFQPQPPQPAYGNINSPAAAFPRIESVNGTCDIYEIPLTMRYDFNQNGKNRLFVNGGLSTYLLRSQEYTYYFHDGGRAYAWPNENDTHMNYWFAIGNLSAGIEHDLGRGFSFQFEPFVRVPFRDIGAGNLRLNSYGMVFSFRFTPVLGRTRK